MFCLLSRRFQSKLGDEYNNDDDDDDDNVSVLAKWLICNLGGNTRRLISLVQRVQGTYSFDCKQMHFRFERVRTGTWCAGGRRRRRRRRLERVINRVESRIFGWDRLSVALDRLRFSVCFFGARWAPGWRFESWKNDTRGFSSENFARSSCGACWTLRVDIVHWSGGVSRKRCATVISDYVVELLLHYVPQLGDLFSTHVKWCLSLFFPSFSGILSQSNKHFPS